MKTETTQTAQHTAGPWFNYIAPHGTRHILPCPEPTLGAVQICTFNGSFHYPVGETEANARLIAAAPNLLSALVAMLNRYGDKSAFPTCDASISARAAIAKAEGNK